MIGITGINHTKAQINIRGKFIFSNDEVGDLADFLKSKTPIKELVVLSTCNRTEIYYYQENNDIESTNSAIRKLLHNFRNLETNYSDRFYFHKEKEAVKHLFSVISGIDSLIFGEDQIVKQVKDAYVHCTNLALTDAVLMRLFQKSFETSKKVRTETSIQNGTTSISYIAAERCLGLFSNLSDKNLLIIGTGETGKLSLLNMVKKGVRNFTIANRTREKAVALAKEYNGKAIPFDEIINYLPDSDIIVTVTESKNFVISKEDIIQSLGNRNGRFQVYIDLSVPRNIDERADDIAEIKLMTIDDLKEIADSNSVKRVESKILAENIINEMVAEYFEWLKTRSLSPIISKITSNIQKLYEEEKLNYKKLYPADVIDAIDDYTGKLTQKYIRSVIKNLKEINANGHSATVLKAIEELFIFNTDDK